MRVEARTILYLALSRVFISDWYNRSPGGKHIIENLRKCLPNNLKEQTDDLKKIFEENGILEALEKFINALENQGHVFINYMKMFAVIL